MYNWLSIRIKSRLGLAFSKADLDYLMLERIKAFPGITNLRQEGDLASFRFMDIRPLYLRLRPHSDSNVLEQVLVNFEYEAAVAIFRDRFEANGTVRIVDAGANVGYTSAYFYSQFADANIVCIEPDEGNIQVLRKNLKTEIESGSARILPNALMNKSGLNIATDNSFRDGADWSISVIETEAQSDIKSVSLSEIMTSMGWNEIDILKIDIEGAERFIFKAGENLDWLNETKVLALEIHDEFAIRESIYSVLQEHEFEIMEHGETTIGVNRSLVKKHHRMKLL